MFRISKINSAVFPYYQGGPLEHIIAGKAICFIEALKPEFKEYARNITLNTEACQKELRALGAKVSETENHLFLLNTLDSYGLTGKKAQEMLEEIDITANKNMIPNDTLSPKETSGLRIGFAAVTTRGCSVDDAKEIAVLIDGYLSQKLTKEAALSKVSRIVMNWKKSEEL